MIKFDFSEAKKEWFDIKGTNGNWKKLAQEALYRFLQPLFQKLDFKETGFWVVFFIVSFSCTGIILRFVNSFSEDQDKYQTALTSVGRNHVEYNNLMANTPTSTKM